MNLPVLSQRRINSGTTDSAGAWSVSACSRVHTAWSSRPQLSKTRAIARWAVRSRGAKASNSSAACRICRLFSVNNAVRSRPAARHRRQAQPTPTRLDPPAGDTKQIPVNEVGRIEPATIERPAPPPCQAGREPAIDRHIDNEVRQCVGLRARGQAVNPVRRPCQLPTPRIDHQFELNEQLGRVGFAVGHVDDLPALAAALVTPLFLGRRPLAARLAAAGCKL